MSSPLKNIILPDGTEYYFTATVVVDSTLSSTSENPVQNKVIKSALDTKQDAATAINTSNIGSQSVAYATTAGSVSRATFGDMNNATHNANDMTSNGLYYYTTNGPSTSLGASNYDGAIYAQAYSTDWVAQIAQDYRNGTLFVRGKNNGTWQAWKRIIDSNNIGSQSVSYATSAGVVGVIRGTTWVENVNNTSNKSGLIHRYGDQNMLICANWSGNDTIYALEIGVISGGWRHCPRSDNHVDVGSPGNRYRTVYAVTGSINTSDRNKKKDIHPIDDKYMSLFDKLKPVSYQFIDGESGRTHVGFISQDIEESMKDIGLSSMDFAGFCRDKKVESEYLYNDDGSIKERIEHDVLDKEGNPEYIYSLRYDEFIALNTMAIKRAEKRIDELERRLAEWTK